LDAYTGTYREPAYGAVTIGFEDMGLVLSWSSIKVPLRHFHFDTFLVAAKTVPIPQVAEELVVFSLNGDGEVATLRFLGRTFTRSSMPGRAPPF
jgi:hypothetical protein